MVGFNFGLDEYGDQRRQQEGFQQQSAMTDVTKCVAVGDGLSSATTRKLAGFTIEAYDPAGEPRTTGGDRWVVAIHGRGNTVRARVLDQWDGKYAVEYKPNVSGRYRVAVTLNGRQLPGSPFTCIVTTPTPSSPHCILRGPALLNAIARKEEYFEVQFRDALGQIAHAEELDVYVDQISEEEQLEIMATRQAEQEAAKAKEEAEEAAAKQTKRDQKEVKKREEASKAATESADGPTSPFHASNRPSQRPAGAEGLVPLLKTHDCTVTSAKPLVVRAGLEKGSPRLGQLLPGQRLRLLEVVMVEEDGEKTARASVAIVDDVDAKKKRADLPCQENWRDLFPIRPAWLDGIPTPRKQPRPRAMPASPFGPREPPVPPPPQAVEAAEGSGDEDGLKSIGWVTVHKGTRELVTPRGKLQANERQRHMQHWARRIAVDKSIAVTSVTKFVQQRTEELKHAAKNSYAVSSAPRRKKGDAEVALARQGESVYAHELRSDPKRIGFAFGGVEPGRLHARGQLVETHKVHYSIAMCGIYKLHVGLRHEGIELPGSPFLLHVTAGAASALSTRLPPEAMPLNGVVGSEGGCELLLQACDKMGNKCTLGGANVSCFSSNKEKPVETDVVDNDDGTYLLRMRSKFSGSFDTYVTIDGLDVLGSPAPMRLLSDNPDLTQTELEGVGLKKATAGKSTTFTLRFKDQYGNAADPGNHMVFEMCLLRQAEMADAKTPKAERAAAEKAAAERFRSAPAHPYEIITDKEYDETLEVRYTPHIAGNLELHLWIVRPENRAMGGQAREPLPDSPFLVHCAAGKAHAHGSSVDGFTRLEVVVDRKAAAGAGAQQQQAGAGQQVKPGYTVTPKRDPRRDIICSYEQSMDVFAGEPISVRPRIRDRLGNNTAAPDGSLAVMLEHPDGTSREIAPTVTIRSGLTNYDVRYEPTLAGKYQMHVNLKGAPIAGSPVRFECIPNYPDVAKSRYILPTDVPALLANKDYVIKVITCDRCGNQLDHGGASVQGRLQSANLPPQQNAMLDVEDKEDGTYLLKINLQAASELKVIITVDKERQGEGGGEFAPIPMTFANLEALNKKAAKQAKQAAMIEQAAVDGRPWSMGNGYSEEITEDEARDAALREAMMNTPGSPGKEGDSDSDTPISAHESLNNPLDAAGSGGRARARVKRAGEEIIAAFGSTDGRRGKVAGMAMVADAAKDAAKDAAVKNATSSMGSTGSGDRPPLATAVKNAKSSTGSGDRPAGQSFGTSATSSFGASSQGSDGSGTARAKAALNAGALKARGEQLLKRQNSSFGKSAAKK